MKSNGPHFFYPSLQQANHNNGNLASLDTRLYQEHRQQQDPAIRTMLST
jgi:hypothetical protein